MEGFNKIDGWGVWECARSCIVSLDDVPGPYRKAFSTALATVFKKVEQAGDNQALLARSLKWLLAMGKLLLREPRRAYRKGKGTGELSKKFEALQKGNWGTLLSLCLRDEDIESRRREAKKHDVKEAQDAAIA